MKTMTRKNLLTAGLCALALSFGTLAYAEKGAETLVRLAKGTAPATPVAAATDTAHKCAACTDAYVTVVDRGTKGPNHLVSKVVRHNCSSCTTKFVTEGVGRAKKTWPSTVAAPRLSRSAAPGN